MTIDELIQSHLAWIIAHLAVMYCALAGALVRLLLVRHEPLLLRLQNCLAGVILALVLAPITAAYFNQGAYAEGYAIFYGIVARELVVSFVDTVNDKAIPLYNQLIDALPFTNSNKSQHKDDDL